MRQITITKVTIPELEALSEAINTVDIPDIIYRSFEHLLRTLESEHGITVSDRRAAACIKVLQGEAILNQGFQRHLNDINSAIKPRKNNC